MHATDWMMDRRIDRHAGMVVARFNWIFLLHAEKGQGRAELGQTAAMVPSVGSRWPGISVLWIWGVGSLQGLLCLSQQQWVLVSVRDKGSGRDGPWG